jgi:HAD superfamily hydrolase (TIGR01509 family)
VPNPNPAVTLDLWHTLVYLTSSAEESYMDSQMDLAAEVLDDAPAISGAPRRSRAELRREFQKVYAGAVSASQRGVSVPPAEQLRQAAEVTGRTAAPDRYVEGLRRLVSRTPFQIGPGAIATVRALRARGWRTAVISNTIGEPGATLRPILTTMGFDEAVEEYLFSDELPWTKPDPAIFREALRRLGSDPSHAVHVGDGWPDIEGPKRARMKAGILYTGLQTYGTQYQTLFLPPGWASPSADYRIERLEELPALVDRILGPPQGA